ncbi:hypothetical protein F4775DRAFT_598538 [Biscogniauxia sp. FL1348]|nr:hypothetical protein F4775DRAFT_598538 [Biscogniauxia sp. FL1348]
MRILLLPPSLVLSLLLQTAPTIVRALENDFSAYPSGSQQCLYDAADQTTCTGNSGAELNQCLCRNKGNFYNTATCVAKASPSDLVAVWETLDYNCEGTGVTIAVSKEAFLAQASAVISSSTPTATTTASPSSSDAASTPGTLSSTAKIGIGVGIGFGSVSLCLAAWFVWVYSRRRRSAAQAGATAIPPGSSAGPWAPSTEYTNSYGMAATSTPSVEFAHMNIQQGGAAELPPREIWKQEGAVELPPCEEWKQHSVRKTNSTANMPLLAELSEGAGQIAPVELPGSTVEDQQHYQQQQQHQQQHQQQPDYEQDHTHENNNRDSARYSDQSIGQQIGPDGIGQRSVSPVDGLSPTVYSQVAAHDVSPYSTYSSHY